jgi:hypothetical protein
MSQIQRKKVALPNTTRLEECNTARNVVNKWFSRFKPLVYIHESVALVSVSLFTESTFMTTSNKSVFVHAYLRRRLARLEHVCAHFRSPPSS